MQIQQTEFEALMLRESPDAFVVMTVAGEVLYWSRGAEAIFGYASTEAVGRQIFELIVPPEGVAGEMRALAEAVSTGFTTSEAIRRCKDGSFVFVDSSRKRVQGPDGSTLVLATKKNVTRLKVMRHANLIEARYRDILESTPDAIAMVNPTGHVVFANGQAEKLFGFAAGEMRGISVDLLLPPRFRGAHVGHRSKYFSQPRNRSMGVGLELYGLRKDSTEFPVEISLSPLQTEEGTLVMSAIRDISERKHFERALQDKNEELETANRAKSTFLATMSHELRTPLNAIIGFTGTLLMKLPGPLNTDQEKQLKTVQSSGRHLLALINDLLDLAKIEAGKVELNLEPTECRAVIEEIAAVLKPQALAKGLDFEATLPPDELFVRTDRRALSQVVLNLANNAIKFTEKGGVYLDLAERTRDGDRQIEISVRDTGSGIRSADRAKLFAAFSRVDAAGGKQEGTGLGLYLSVKLAELLGGRITCDSNYGSGSTFRLILVQD